MARPEVARYRFNRWKAMVPLGPATEPEGSDIGRAWARRVRGWLCEFAWGHGSSRGGSLPLQQVESHGTTRTSDRAGGVRYRPCLGPACDGLAWRVCVGAWLVQRGLATASTGGKPWYH